MKFDNGWILQKMQPLIYMYKVRLFYTNNRLNYINIKKLSILTMVSGSIRVKAAERQESEWSGRPPALRNSIQKIQLPTTTGRMLA